MNERHGDAIAEALEEMGWINPKHAELLQDVAGAHRQIVERCENCDKCSQRDACDCYITLAKLDAYLEDRGLL